MVLLFLVLPRMRLLLVILFLGISFNAFCQNEIYKVGLFAGYNNVYPNVSASISDKYLISGSSGLDGYEVGIFGSIKKQRGYWESQLTYLMNRSNLGIENLKWQEDLAQYGAAEIAGGIGITSRMVRLSIDRGYFFARNFSINGGIIGIIQIDDPHYQEWPEELFQDWQKDMSSTVFEFGRSINRFMLSGEAAVAYHFGPLICSFSLEKNFTPVASSVEYEMQHYPVKYNYFSWTVGFAYTIFDSKR